MPNESSTAEAPRRRQRRTANACVACRQSKIKCSGNEPCRNCQRRLIQCRFDDDARVTVTERYLQELRRQAGLVRSSEPGRQRWDGSSSTAELRPEQQEPHPSLDNQLIAYDTTGPPGDVLPRPPSNDSNGRSLWTSPFTGHFRTIKNTHANRRSWIWLAPSSTWSFTARLVLLLEDKLGLDARMEKLPSLSLRGEEIYSLKLGPTRGSDPNDTDTPDISGLPSVDYALYLFRTVRFHLGQTYNLIEEDPFLEGLNDFYYKNAAHKASSSRLWYVQFRIVLAFGNAFLHNNVGNNDAPGSVFFSRAMALIPDHLALWKDSILAIEVSALAALYLYSVDRREPAHVYLGQAVRIAQLEGLHVQLPEDELGASTILRCRKLWWTLYIMDRHFSSSLGVPTIINDHDTTATMSTPSSTPLQEQISPTFKLHVQLSRLHSHIVTSIYRETRAQLDSFLETTRDILQWLAETAQEIEHIVSLRMSNSVDSMSKETRNVALLYHQCVLKATRPLLLSVLKERLESLDRNDDEKDWKDFISLTKQLISTGIVSAIKTIDILSSDETLLQMFLPLDLEYTFGAALHLAMAYVLFPDLGQEYKACSDKLQTLLDGMIQRGNKLAIARNQELSHLYMLFSQLSQRTSQRGYTTLTLDSVRSDTPAIDPVALNSPHMAAQRSVSDSLVRSQGERPPQTEMVDRHTYLTPKNTATSVDVADGAYMEGDAAPSLFGPGQKMALDHGHDFLAAIGISSDHFFSIVDQMNQLDNCFDVANTDM